MKILIQGFQDADDVTLTEAIKLLQSNRGGKS